MKHSLVCVLLLWNTLPALVCGAEDGPPFQPPQYDVLRTAGPIAIDGRLDEPSWEGAPALADFQFPWWKSGPKDPTIVKVLWDDEHLYVAAICEDGAITAAVKDRDGPVSQDDCFEIMVAPRLDRPEVYFNLEWNVLGTVLDNFRPHGPKLPRAPKWDAVDLVVGGTYAGTLNDDSDRDRHWITEAAIPWKNFTDHATAIPPAADSIWRANFNRHGGRANPQYSQWSAGNTPTPSFHTPDRFGELRFRAERVPTGQARRFPIHPIEAAARMAVPEGVRVIPFAAEPHIRQPILVKCDDRGRLWVIQYLQYPNPAGLERVQVDRWSRTTYDRIPEPPPRGPRGADRITICEDTDGDGRADRFVDFVEGLNLCTGLAHGHGGLFVLQVPYLLFYPDRNRDDVPDQEPEVLLTGFGMEDAQSFANHLTWGPDGWLYGVNGSTTTCNIRGIEFQQGVWRYHPITKDFELFCEGGGNLFGLTFDHYGQMFFTSNGGDLSMHGLQGAYYRKAFGKHGPLHNPHAHGYLVDIAKSTPVVGGPCAGGTIYDADRLPSPLAGAFLCSDFLGHTCSWWKFEAQGSTFRAVRGGTLIGSNDTWFGATDLGVGPDGSVYVSDFHDKRTAHPDPDAQWDRSTGRIYRLVAADAQFTAPAKSSGSPQSLDSALEQLTHPNGRTREQARHALAQRGAASHSPLLAGLRQTADERRALESLWALHLAGGFTPAVARELLDHASPHVRLWAVRLAGDHRFDDPSLATGLRQLAEREDSPSVQVQLAASAQRFDSSIALPVLWALIDRASAPSDPTLDWMLWWGLEKHLDDQLSSVVERFRTASASPHATRAILRAHVIRRCAAVATAASLAACEQLLESADASAHEELLVALDRGLAERGVAESQVGQGDLFRASSRVSAADPVEAEPGSAIPPALRDRIARLWREKPDDLFRMRLALRAAVPEAERHLLSGLTAAELDASSRVARLSLLAEYGPRESLPAILEWVSEGQPEAVQLAALSVVRRWTDRDTAEKLLGRYAGSPEKVRAALREVLLSRADSAALLLAAVDRGEVDPAEFDLGSLRAVALHQRDELNRLVRKHWGKVDAGTPEEKLAIMRRLNNDLRVEGGDPVAGKALFQKHCANCHRLFGEGERVGPDLTNTSRQDTEYLLASLVDPSAVIRREYVSSVVTTTDGQVLTGLILEQDGASVTLVDAKGQKRRIERAGIEELHDAETSLMPEGLPLGLTPAELRNLFAYLQ